MANIISLGMAEEKFTNGGGGIMGVECGEREDAPEGVKDEDILAAVEFYLIDK